MFQIGRPSEARLARVLAGVAGAPVTYPEVGATADPDRLPAGYRHARVTRRLGEGDAVFAAAADGLRTWALHRGQGFRVLPASPPVAEGTEVLVDLPLVPGVHVIATCRVVWAVDEPDRVGFGYGTLPVHPASGEEAFVVTRDATGVVRVDVYAFSRPRHPLVRLGGPLARRQQARATAGYAAALDRHVRSRSGSGP
jgi:uncharacterized protein (UPF0548 family)